MTALPPSGTFVMVDPAHVAEVGPAAALLFARICWRADRDGFWKASRAVLAQETGLTPDTVRGALRVLRERAWVKGERASRDDATMLWSPVLAGQNHRGDFPIGSGEFPHLPDRGDFPISSLETVETTTDPTAGAVPELPEEELMGEPAEAPGLFDAPVVASSEPPMNGGTLVGRWVDGYRTTNDGADPPRPLMKRVAGQMGRLAKDCGEDRPAWSAAWAAVWTAGRAGRPDAVPFMRKDTGPRYGRVNHDLAIYEQLTATGGSGALSGPAGTALGMLNPATTNPPGGTP